MAKKEYIIAGLLAVSLIFNYVTWSQLQEVMEQQFTYATQQQVNEARDEIYFLHDQINQIKQERAWIQDSSFEFNRESSDFYNANLEGQWTFKQLKQDQTPYLLLKKEDAEWKEIKLDKLSGLTYGTVMKLSTESNYQYKLTAKGPTSQSTEVRSVPYHLYGIPRVEVKYAKSGTSENGVIFDFMAIVDPNPVFEEMVPEEIFVELQRDGEPVQKVKLVPSKKEDNVWKVNWTAEDIKSLEDYKLFTIAKFSNGFTKREEVKRFGMEF
ncbi:hypothetical protein ACFO3D_18520 [Virgibacillus kekensis]|uniref:Uncharacterized protein n=1 Tax=Virgibacillus kekensis TaxID=202261 RepID=A0ABV9DN38_9BACI